MIKRKLKRSKPLPLYKTVPKSVREIGERVLNLVTRGWCKRTFAIDNKGNRVTCSMAKNIYKICLAGAISRANGIADTFDIQIEFRRILSSKIGSIILFNDNSKTTKKDVIKAVESVIRKA